MGAPPAKMTRHDYLDIAAAIAAAFSQATLDEKPGAILAAIMIGRMLERRSTSFDFTLFLKNCGIESTRDVQQMIDYL
jgi:hypothetical protein